MKYLGFVLTLALFMLFSSLNPAHSDSFGSAFLVSSHGHLVTNFHVVESAIKIQVSINGKKYHAKLLTKDTANDIAILQIAGTFKHLNFKDTSEISLGSEIYAIGFPNPDVQGVSPKVSNGIISSLAGLSDDPRHFQISCSIQPGNSGGPIVDKDGNYLGIVTSTLSPFLMAKNRGSLPQNVNFAIKNSYLQPLIPWAKSEAKCKFSSIGEIVDCVGLVQASSLPFEPPQAQGAISIGNARFVRDESGVIFDRKTNLKWLEGPDQPVSWNQASLWIKNSGKSWRFPTIEELKSIYDPSSKRKGDPTVGGIPGYRISLGLDPAFKSQKAYSVWGTEVDKDSANMFGFSSGFAFIKSKYYPLDMYRALAVSE